MVPRESQARVMVVVMVVVVEVNAEETKEAAVTYSTLFTSK